MGELTATDAIILYSNDSDIVYAEHYDIIEGEMKNAKPAEEGIFQKFKSSTGQTIVPQKLNNIVFISDSVFAFTLNAGRRLISANRGDKIIQGYLRIPKLLFEANIISCEVRVYMVIGQYLYDAPFPNITGGKICFGSMDMKPLLEGTFNTMARNITDAFFQTNFSSHYSDKLFKSLCTAIETKQAKHEYEKTKIKKVSNYLAGLTHRLL